MKLFQYWNADPPAEILASMATAERAGFDYARLDEPAARAFVACECEPRALAAWDALALPAMQSDLLRLLLLERYGGVYLDAGFVVARPLAGLAARSHHGQLPALIALVFNGYLMAREAADPFVRACLYLLLDNVEHRRFDSALMAVGPGVINAVRAVLLPEESPYIRAQAQSIESWMRWGWPDCLAHAERLIEPTPERVAAARGFDIVYLGELEGYARTGWSPHRQRDDHWTRWRRPIYR